jgi:N-acetylmuramoyl-L-alanine amidase
MALTRVWIRSPNYSSRGGSGVRLVVVHTAEGARSFRDLGNFFASSSAGVSSHVGIDDERGTIGEYVKRPDKAWTQGNYNPQCVSVELCAKPINSAHPCGANWSADEWNRHDGMLANLADWIREECSYYGLPLTKLSASQAQGSGGGVCGHVDLGAAGGGHWDPGPNFPWSRVMDLARGGTTGPAPAPEPKPIEEGDMVASAKNAAGSLHVFVAQGDKITYTWQKAGDTAWHGGQPGKSVAGLSQFATSPAGIVGIDAALSDAGALHLFVHCDDGKTRYTYQGKGKTGWNGGEAGKTVAGLGLFAP